MSLLAPETWVAICQNLRRPDLKRLRLVSKATNSAAEEIIFEDVSIFRNMESFCRLRCIASDPKLSKLVKRLCYSGRLLGTPLKPIHVLPGLIPIDWLSSKGGFQLWQKFCSTMYAVKPNHSIGEQRDNMITPLTDDEQLRYYRKACAIADAQRMLASYPSLEITDLVTIIDSLTRLEEVIFDVTEYSRENADELMDGDSTSTIARETLMEPTIDTKDYSILGRGRQLLNLLEAVLKSGRSIKSFQALGLDMHLLGARQFLLENNKLVQVSSSCQELVLHLRPDPRGSHDIESMALANVIDNASSLHTLEISQGKETSHSSYFSLGDLWNDQIRWPHLKKLNLQCCMMSKDLLEAFLLSQASTLETLELGHLHLIYDPGTYGPWSDTITVLEASLTLKHMTFSYSLSSTYEHWVIKEIKALSVPKGRVWLKHRIEQYVVHGGINPFVEINAKKLRTKRQRVSPLAAFTPASEMNSQERADIGGVNNDPFDDSWCLDMGSSALSLEV